MTTVHAPVLRDAVVTLLQPQPGDIIIDATIGGGGHAAALLERIMPGGRLIGFDRDAAAVATVRERFSHYRPDQFFVNHSSFSELKRYCDQQQLTGRVNGIVFDLGFSSDQLEKSGRGFSFQADAEPLDLRFDVRLQPDAAGLLQTVSVTKLTEYFRNYGELPNAKRLAAAIVSYRQQQPLLTVADLKNAVRRAVPRFTSHRLAPIWQAVRLAVNHELEELTSTLPDAFNVLSAGGRIVVITFHSLEDRIVKHQFRALTQTHCQCPPEMPLCVCQTKPVARSLTPKPLRPTTEECANNPRARSAKLRAIVKL